MSGKYSKRILSLSLFVLVTLLAFFLRVHPTYQSVQGYGEYITDPDALYHLIRVQDTLEHYPHVPVKTMYEEYPEGSDYESPPLYPFLLATPLKVLSLFGSLSDMNIRRVLSFWGPLSGILAIWALYLLTGHFFADLRPRLLVLLSYTCLPIALNYTSYGNIDYHGFIIACTSFLYYSVLRRNVSLSVVAFIVLVGTWQAGLYQSLILAIAFFGYGLLTKDMAHFAVLRRMFFWSAPVFFVLVLYVSLRGAWLLSPAFFGWGTFLLVVSFGFFSLALETRKVIWSGVGLIVLGPIIPVVVQGFLVLYFNPIPWLQSVQESTPLLFLYREFTLRPMVYLLTPLALLTPLIWIYLCLKWRKEVTLEKVFLITAYLCHGSAAMAMARYSNQWAPFVVIMLVLGWWLLPKGRIAVFLLLLVNMFPIYGALSSKTIREDHKVVHASMLHWKTTPPTRGWGDPSVQPEYGVLTDWEYAPQIEYYGRRPVIIDARGPMSTDWKWVGDFYLNEDEEQSYRLATARSIRYVMVKDFYSTLNIFPLWIGKTIDFYFEYDGDKAFPKRTMIKTTGFRLCELLSGNYGQSDLQIEGMNHFRLVWLSKEQVSEGGHLYPWWFKIYEIVQGCHIHLAEPGQLQARLILPNGHMIPYSIKSDARNLIIVPYPSESFENLTIRSGSRTYEVTITEEMVRKGSPVHLN